MLLAAKYLYFLLIDMESLSFKDSGHLGND